MSGYVFDRKYAVTAEARRRWSVAEKSAVVAETERSSVSAVARRHGISASLLFRWRRELRARPAESGAGLVPVVVAQAEAPRAGALEIVLKCGRRIRLEGSVDGAALRTVLWVLEGRA